MARLARTLAALSHYRRAFDAAFGRVDVQTSTTASRLRESSEFGPNPGNLRMLSYVPETVADDPALVVVLHGCTQDAARYDNGAGWSRLADELGFVLLFPEQRSANNPKSCFTWFEQADIRRDAGEALSIRSMVAQMVVDHRVAPGRIFITGLSAGGAMANVMAATYPEVFAAAAIVAGLPYGTATSVPEAFEAMFQGRSRPARTWGDLVRAASPHRGPWPKISVWHGAVDRTVVASNAIEIVKQWTDVWGLPATPASTQIETRFSREVWQDAAGRNAIELIVIPGMAHGTPLAVGEGEGRGGMAGPFLLDVGISSTHHIAQFFGLCAGPVSAERAGRQVDAAAKPPIPAPLRPQDILLVGERDFPEGGEPDPTPARHLPIGIRGVIEKALRAAGLMHR